MKDGGYVRYLLVPEGWKPADDWLPGHHLLREVYAEKKYWEQERMPKGVKRRIVKATVIYEWVDEDE